MNGAVHFIGFDMLREPQRYSNAAAVYGLPDFTHRTWDVRARAEIMPGDVAIFARYYGTEPSVYSFDDSANQ